MGTLVIVIYNNDSKSDDSFDTGVNVDDIDELEKVKVSSCTIEMRLSFEL